MGGGLQPVWGAVPAGGRALDDTSLMPVVSRLWAARQQGSLSLHVRSGQPELTPSRVCKHSSSVTVQMLEGPAEGLARTGLSLLITIE